MRHWTNKEISILKDAYVNGGTNSVIEKLPHRTKCSIRTLAKRLKLNLSIEAYKNMCIDNLRKTPNFVDYEF